MPLLLCPNDNGPMQIAQRSGVEFDICPACRGVWLDRGELEKLVDAARADDGGGPAADPGPYRRGNDGHRPPARVYECRDDDDHHRRKKRRPSIFYSPAPPR